MRVLLVVPRYEVKLLAFLEQKFAGDAEIAIMQDRRLGPRRKVRSMRNQERRRQDRRGAGGERLGTFILMRTEAAPSA